MGYLLKPKGNKLGITHHGKLIPISGLFLKDISLAEFFNEDKTEDEMFNILKSKNIEIIDTDSEIIDGEINLAKENKMLKRRIKELESEARLSPSTSKKIRKNKKTIDDETIQEDETIPEGDG